MIAQQWGMQALEIMDLAPFRHRVSLIRRNAQRLSVSARSFLPIFSSAFPCSQPTTGARESLHGHAFGQVAWLVHVGAARAGRVIGQQLQGHDVEDGA